jgi:hypothetical protein
LIVSFVKKNINNLLKKKAIDQYIQDTIQVFEFWHNLCSELTSILAIKKQPTNRPQLNKSDRPQVNIWNTWKTLKCILLHNTFPSATVFSFNIFTCLIFRKLNKPQSTRIKQQNLIRIRAFDSRLYLDISRSFKCSKCSPVVRFLKIINSTLTGLVDYF